MNSIYINNFIKSGNDINNIIRKDIKEYYDNMPCCVCGKDGNVETVFKNDLFNEERLFYHDGQQMNDFMSLCNTCVELKTYANEIELKTNQLYSIKNMKVLAPFVKYMDWNDNACFDSNDSEAKVNSYWYDPVRFMNRIEMNVSRFVNYRQNNNNEQDEY